MNTLKLIAVSFLPVALFTAGCASTARLMNSCPMHRYVINPLLKPHQSDNGEADSQSASSAAEVVEVAQTTCPVMGGKVDPNLFVDYEGRRVYFCCPGCEGTFSKDPGKYLSKLDAAEAEPKPE